jgi:hypothetical protein
MKNCNHRKRGTPFSKAFEIPFPSKTLTNWPLAIDRSLRLRFMRGHNYLGSTWHRQLRSRRPLPEADQELG